ncbi:unnamed protein product [Caenorhabditis bovis]|uniref:Uncharacterized protein n=1 Tax=Caenorhabditis bovis TaxID=2654633 RepID=A0A8S1EHC9_9PELO|nr:unnamed protein product [Caenorhabditis bovis]
MCSRAEIELLKRTANLSPTQFMKMFGIKNSTNKKEDVSPDEKYKIAQVENRKENQNAIQKVHLESTNSDISFEKVRNKSGLGSKPLALKHANYNSTSKVTQKSQIIIRRSTVCHFRRKQKYPKKIDFGKSSFEADVSYYEKLIAAGALKSLFEHPINWIGGVITSLQKELNLSRNEVHLLRTMRKSAYNKFYKNLKKQNSKCKQFIF